jgi:hypothetical protein
MLLLLLLLLFVCAAGTCCVLIVLNVLSPVVQVRATLGGARAAAAAAAVDAAARAAAEGTGDPAAAAAAAAAAALAAASLDGSSSSCSSGRSLAELVALPSGLSKAVQAALKQQRLREPKGGLDGKAWCSEKFRANLREFLEGKVQAYSEVRAKLGLPVDARGSGPGAQMLEYVAGCVGLTQQELEAFVRRCLEKYEAKRVDAGEGCAVVCCGVVRVCVGGWCVVARRVLWQVFVRNGC